MRHWSVLPSGSLSLSGPSTASSTRCSVAWPPPHRWQRLSPRPNTRGQAWELFPCKTWGQNEIRLDGSAKTKADSRIHAEGYSRLWSFILQDLEGTVNCGFVAVGLQTLQKSEWVWKMAKHERDIHRGCVCFLPASLSSPHPEVYFQKHWQLLPSLQRLRL